MADKWVISAPVWKGAAFYIGREYMMGWIKNYPDEYTPWHGVCSSGNAKRFHTEADARAWVEAQVMQDMGATPHSHDDKTAY